MCRSHSCLPHGLLCGKSNSCCQKVNQLRDLLSRVIFLCHNTGRRLSEDPFIPLKRLCRGSSKILICITALINSWEDFCLILYRSPEVTLKINQYSSLSVFRGSSVGSLVAGSRFWVAIESVQRPRKTLVCLQLDFFHKVRLFQFLSNRYFFFK